MHWHYCGFIQETKCFVLFVCVFCPLLAAPKPPCLCHEVPHPLHPTVATCASVASAWVHLNHSEGAVGTHNSSVWVIFRLVKRRNPFLVKFKEDLYIYIYIYMCVCTCIFDFIDLLLVISTQFLVCVFAWSILLLLLLMVFPIEYWNLFYMYTETVYLHSDWVYVFITLSLCLQQCSKCKFDFCWMCLGGMSSFWLILSSVIFFLYFPVFSSSFFFSTGRTVKKKW